MKLSAEQVRQFDELGYLFFPNCFSEDEIALMRTEGDAILKLDRPEVWREKSGAPRTAFAAHKFNDVFRLLAHHPRLVEPLEQIFGESLYVHQFKLNAKAAFEGDVWQWHQDYGTWARDDGMPEPRAMNIAVFLDEVFPFNGALMLIPGSHKEGTLQAGHDLKTTSYPLWTLDQDTVTRLCRQAERGGEPGIVAPTGKPGSVLMFHGNLVHASAPNITPYPRKIVYLTLCAVSNHITKFNRPEFIAHRDFTPIATGRRRCADRARPRASRRGGMTFPANAAAEFGITPSSRLRENGFALLRDCAARSCNWRARCPYARQARGRD